MDGSHSAPSHTRRLLTADQAALVLHRHQWTPPNDATTADDERDHMPPPHQTTSADENRTRANNHRCAYSSSDESQTTAEQHSSGDLLTPFLFDETQFELQDIFDLPTFATLVAETAAEYALRPLKSFPPTAQPDQSQYRSHAHAEPNVLLKAAASPALPDENDSFFSARSPQSDDEFQRLAHEMHMEEVDEIIRADPALALLQQQTAAYKHDRSMLERAFDLKLSRLTHEFEQLQQRNEKLHQLASKVQAIDQRVRSSGVSVCSSSASSCASSPSTTVRRVSSQFAASSISATSSGPPSRCVTPPPPSRSPFYR